MPPNAEGCRFYAVSCGQRFGIRGFEVDMSAAGYKPDGTLNAVYLKQEAGGFALHIVRRP